MEQKKKVMIGICAAAAVVIVAGAGFLLYANSLRHYEYVYPNVTCDGVALSGMTRQEAEAAIGSLIDGRQYQVTVELPGEEPWTILPEQTVTERTPGAALEQVWNYGREDSSFFGPYRAYRAAKKTETDVSLEYALDFRRESVAEQVEALKAAVTVEPTDCAGYVDEAAHTAVIVPGEKGRTIDPEALTEQVCQALEDRNETLEADFTEIPLVREQLTALVETLADEGYVAVTEPVMDYDAERETSLLNVGTPGYDLDVAAAVDAVLTASAAGEDTTLVIPLDETAPGEYDLDRFYWWLKRDPAGIYYQDGALYGGTPGYDFDLETAEAAEAAAGYGDTVEIPLVVTQPVVSIDYANQVLFRDQLARADTNHTSLSARTNNLILSCQALDGTIVNPGEEFSFNEVVGERTAAKGYQAATVYLSTGNEAQLGGGICQTASTLYMAALKAGMKITERSEHMYTVSYCPLGLDATIYWGSCDFRFVNTSYMPIRINASVSGGQVHMSIDGTNFTGHYIQLSTEQVGSLAYRAYRTIYNPDGSEYYTEDLGVSRYSSH